MRRTVLLLLWLVFAWGFARSPTEADAASAWLRRDAIPLASLIPGDASTDLEPLEQFLAGVRLVGLGESTHGTREFFTLKHRLLEFLVAEMGVTTLLIEASYPASLAVNDYVVRGRGDPNEALSSLGFWMYDTEEMTSLIEWLREYNRRVPEAQKVSFLGFDFQHAGAAPGRGG